MSELKTKNGFFVEKMRWPNWRAVYVKDGIVQEIRYTLTERGADREGWNMKRRYHPNGFE